MTGNLSAMMHMHDLRVAEDIGKMAELGWFDVEFTMYGCAYMFEGKMRYKISSEAKDIYDYIEHGAKQGVYPSNVLSLTEKCPVPAGMKELIAQDVKKDLGRKLREVYPQAFFEELYALAQAVTTNSAAALLWAEAEALEGVFEEEKLKYFEELVDYAYSCRKLEQTEYAALLQWIASERRDMEDDFVSKDIFEKTLYGIAYAGEAGIEYMTNAQKEYVYEKMHELEQAGSFTTPLFSKTYWYNYVYRLVDVNRDFKKKIRQELDEPYINKIMAIRTGECALTKEAYASFAEAIRKKYGDKPYKTLLRYGYRWGVV